MRATLSQMTMQVPEDKSDNAAVVHGRAEYLGFVNADNANHSLMCRGAHASDQLFLGFGPPHLTGRHRGLNVETHYFSGIIQAIGVQICTCSTLQETHLAQKFAKLLTSFENSIYILPRLIEPRHKSFKLDRSMKLSRIHSPLQIELRSR